MQHFNQLSIKKVCHIYEIEFCAIYMSIAVYMLRDAEFVLHAALCQQHVSRQISLHCIAFDLSMAIAYKTEKK